MWCTIMVDGSSTRVEETAGLKIRNLNTLTTCAILRLQESSCGGETPGDCELLRSERMGEK